MANLCFSMGVDVQRRRALALGAWAAAVAAGGGARALTAAGARAGRTGGSPGSGAAGGPAVSPPPAPGVVPTAAGAPVAPVVAAAPAGGAAPAAAGGPTPALQGDGLVNHVARRASFGPSPALLADLRGGVDAWIERQLRPWDVEDAEVEAELGGLEALWWTPTQLFAQQRQGTDHVREIRLAAVVRAARSNRQLLEVLVDLWHDFLCTSVAKHPVERFTTVEDRDAIRPNALGRFADLLTAVTLGPAMLHYLDNAVSAPPEVNENHGRELLELHTVGVDAGYGEADVLGAARVLSGWYVDFVTNEYGFDPARHDPAPATVLGWSTPGRTGQDAAGDAPALLQHLAHHPATARRVATVLVQRFVADAPPGDLVASTADVYLASGTDIAATVHHVLTSAWFRAGGAPIARRPFDVLAAMLRASGATLDLAEGTGPLGDQKPAVATALEETLAMLGQPLFEAPSPAGWPVPGGQWISPDALHQRWSAAADIAQQRLHGIRVDPAALAGGAASVGATVDALASRLYGHTATPATRAGAVAVLGNGGDEAAAYAPERLPLVLTFLLAAPEMQLR